MHNDLITDNTAFWGMHFPIPTFFYIIEKDVIKFVEKKPIFKNSSSMTRDALLFLIFLIAFILSSSVGSLLFNLGNGLSNDWTNVKCAFE